MPVDGVGETLLADTGLTEDEDTDVAPGDALHHAVEVLHRAGQRRWSRGALRPRGQLAGGASQQRVGAPAVARIHGRPDARLAASLRELGLEPRDDELEILGRRVDQHHFVVARSVRGYRVDEPDGAGEDFLDGGRGTCGVASDAQDRKRGVVALRAVALLLETQ